MIVVSFDTVDILLKSKRGEESIIPLLINAIQENLDCDTFVAAACDVLSNLSLEDKGASKIVGCGGGLVVHELFTSTQDPGILQVAVQILYNLAYMSTSLLQQLAKTDFATSLIATLKASKDSSLFAASFGLLSLIAGVDQGTREKLSDTVMITMVLDAIRRHAKMPELLEEALSILSSVDYSAGDKQLGLTVAKRILECMTIFPDEEAIQTDGCKILLGIMSAQGESRALKSLLHATSSKETISAVPSSCKGMAHRLLKDF